MTTHGLCNNTAVLTACKQEEMNLDPNLIQYKNSILDKLQINSKALEKTQKEIFVVLIRH